MAEHNLPAPTSPIIGRERELSELAALLQQEAFRLVTLTGPGGVGKTRLALEVAYHLLPNFSHGVFFIALDPLQDPALLPATIAAALGVAECGGETVTETLRLALAKRQLLLVLDNFEHLIMAAPVVSDLLAAAPQLRVLATSREWLRLRGEHNYPVNPLATPTPGQLNQALSAAVVASFSAVELFRQRATAAVRSFELTPANAAAVAEICALLDGLPLAIELAAARLPLWGSAEALQSRLGSAWQHLKGGARDLPAHQQTLQATMEWSYELLAPEEQKLFRRLAAFVGGCTLEAAAAVCDADADLGVDLWDGMAALVDKNLLRQAGEPDGEPRFVMLQTIYAFALEQLRSSGEQARLQQAHANCFLALAEEAAPELKSSSVNRWLEILEQEHDNFRAALGWCRREKRLALMLRLSAALAYFWYLRGYTREGLQVLTGVLSEIQGEVDTLLHIGALRGAGMLAVAQGEYAAAQNFFEDGLAIAQRMEDWDGMARALGNLGIIADNQGDFPAAQSYYERALSLAQQYGNKSTVADALLNLGTVAYALGDPTAAVSYFERCLPLMEETADLHGAALALGNLGSLALYQGDRTAAQSYLERSRTIAEALGDKRQSAVVLADLGLVAVAQGEHELARSRARQSLDLAQELGDWPTTVEVLRTLAILEAATGSAEWAARLRGVDVGQREVMGVILNPLDEAKYERGLQPARQKLGAKGFATALAAGKAMGLEEAVTFAFHSLTPTTAPENETDRQKESMDKTGELTRRELEVLRLVSQGMTDAQVAETLVISPRTVNAHLTSIYGKLDVNSRTAAARRALEQGLV